MKIWQIVLLTSISAILLSVNLSCQQSTKTGQQQIKSFEMNLTARQVVNFNKDWKFSRGDLDGAEAANRNCGPAANSQGARVARGLGAVPNGPVSHAGFWSSQTFLFSHQILSSISRKLRK